MISYDPLWKTMERLGATTYTLQVKGGISSSTIRRLKAGQSVSTNTIDALRGLYYRSRYSRSRSWQENSRIWRVFPSSFSRSMARSMRL